MNVHSLLDTIHDADDDKSIGFSWDGDSIVLNLHSSYIKSCFTVYLCVNGQENFHGYNAEKTLRCKENIAKLQPKQPNLSYFGWA